MVGECLKHSLPLGLLIFHNFGFGWKNRLATLPDCQQAPLTALEDQLDLLLQWKES
jgi:hypothetical protein